MANKQVTLKDPLTGDILLPRTLGIEYQVIDGETIPPYSLTVDNAMHLDGHPSSHYATTDSVSTLNTKVSGMGSDISTVKTEVQSLKTSVSNGKSLVASAITDKGISTAASATFQTMASNIRRINTGHSSGLGNYVTIATLGASFGGSGIATVNPGAYSESVVFTAAMLNQFSAIAQPWMLIGAGYYMIGSTSGTMMSFSTKDSDWDLAISKYSQKILLLKSQSSTWYNTNIEYGMPADVSNQIKWDTDNTIRHRIYNGSPNPVQLGLSPIQILTEVMLPIDSLRLSSILEVH